jgi:hypothetical protein
LQSKTGLWEWLKSLFGRSEQSFVFLEVLPNELGEVVRKDFVGSSSVDLNNIRRAKNNASGYQSINDAIADVKVSGLALMGTVFQGQLSQPPYARSP